MKTAIAVVFLWLVGFTLVLLSFVLPYYFTQYAQLVLGIGVMFFIVGMATLIFTKGN